MNPLQELNMKNKMDMVLIVSMIAAIILGSTFAVVQFAAKIQQFENEISRCKAGDQIACLIIREGD